MTAARTKNLGSWLWGGFIIFLGSVILLWIVIDLLIERQPASVGQNPILPTMYWLMAIACGVQIILKRQKASDVDLLFVAEEVQLLLNEAFEITRTIEPGSALDQSVLREGESIVREHLAAGEPGLAFDQLLYMITEPELELSYECYEAVCRSGKRLDVSPSVWQDLTRAEPT